VPSYQITILFNDAAAPLVLDLPDTDLETAETLTAGMRDEVEQGREVDAPVVTARAPDGSDLALEPGRIVSIDLEETPDPG
jgi:hypothetical protein